jgi:hypothetical protein
MISAQSKDSLAVKPTRMVIVHLGSKTCRLTEENALALAHALFRSRQYKAAAEICYIVAPYPEGNVCAGILSACCKAGLRDFDGCSEILHQLFTGAQAPVADRMHAALVYHALGMPADAAKELTAITEIVPDLAMAWLLLGDELYASGKQEKATLSWRLAIDRDRGRRPVALAARQALDCQRKNSQAAHAVRTPAKEGKKR